MAKVQEEPSWDASAGLLYHLLTGRLANGHIRSDDVTQLFLLRLLLADYAKRSAALPPAIRADFNGRVIDYLGGMPTQHLWAGLGKTLSASQRAHSSALDVAIIATHPEELRATALVFDAHAEPADDPAEPAHVVALDCAHLTGRRLSVGIFRTETSRAGSLGLLISHMRHRRIPRLVCLVGTAAPISADIAPFDVVAPRVVYRVDDLSSAARTDLTGVQPLEPADPGLHGLEAYDPAHTGYQEWLRALLRRIPRHHRLGVKPGQLKPRFHTGSCSAVSGVSLSLEGDDKDHLKLVGEAWPVCIADDEAYEFAESLPSEPWVLFRGVCGSAIAGPTDAEYTYLATAVAALCLRDFLENCYVPPGAAEF